ncbi:MAG TPA: glycosyltransferase family 2 protein [Acidobacteriaceae bacterium]|nr:glycosyltransferase family 2 protein [Acidobacteriaceae bacterium]
MSSVVAMSLHGQFLFAIFAWSIAAAWLSRVIPALWMLPRVPNLLGDSQESADPPDASASWPSVTVIVPAKDEAAAIERSLRSLVDCDYPNLQVFAVDDRSTDATGKLMDELAESPDSHGRIRVLHVTELPDGWLGKPHAMALAAEGAASEWLLFTDGDVIFDPRTIRLAIQYAEWTHGDHMVLYPTLILRGVAEKMLIAFFQSAFVWAGRPWNIPDPKARKDYIGVGAFNLIRRSVYDALGGYSELRMEVLEDMRLGFRVKREGYAQRVAFGKDLVRIRWAESAWGILDNLTKNMYSTFRFRTSLLLAACIGMLLMCLTPFVALFFPGAAQWAGIVTLVALLVLNFRYWRLTDIPPAYLAFFPVATLLFVGTLLRSMILALWRGGVLWRGTLYPLKELRRQAGPLW